MEQKDKEKLIKIFDYFKDNKYNVLNFETKTNTIIFNKIEYETLLKILEEITEKLKLKINRIAYYDKNLLIAIK